MATQSVFTFISKFYPAKQDRIFPGLRLKQLLPNGEMFFIKALLLSLPILFPMNFPALVYLLLNTNNRH